MYLVAREPQVPGVPNETEDHNFSTVPPAGWRGYVLVPQTETADIAFVVGDPGSWMLQCMLQMSRWRPYERSADRLIVTLHLRRHIMKRTFRIVTFLGALALPWPALAGTIHATLYKYPECGCCEGYAAYLRDNGFEVDVKPTDDLAEISSKAGVPAELEGCHTMFVEGYVVDGHVPVNVINKLLTERPAIAGIALPGMPTGSPGMNGEKTGPFIIYAVTKDGAAPTVYASE